jgi:hypothetical protein
MVAFSVWEVELSRYARFYTIFQLMYLISLWCFYRGFLLDERPYKYWFILVALITFATHQLSLILFTLFLIPLPLASFSLPRKLSFGLWAVGLGGLFFFYRKLVAHIGMMGDPLPHLHRTGGESTYSIFESLRSAFGPHSIYTPDLSFMTALVHENPLLFFGFALIPAVATVYLIYRAFHGNQGWHTLMAIPIVWAAFMYQFGLVLSLLAAYIVGFIQTIRSLWESHLKVVYIVVAISLLFWLHIFTMHSEVTLEHKVVAMFGFPNFPKYFLYWFLKGWPLMMAIFSLGIVLLLIRFISDRRDSTSLFILGAIFAPALCASFFRAFAEARYTFHLYPLMLMVIAVLACKAKDRFLQHFHSQRRWCQYIVVPAVILGIFFLSQDANPLAAWSVGNRTYQTQRDPIRGVINWTFFAKYHQDQASPSLYVRERLAPRDKVVVLKGFFYELAVYHFYTGGVDYVIDDCLKNIQYFGRLKNGEIVHYITGSKILGSLPEVKNMIKEGPGAIWLLGDRKMQSFCSKSLAEYLLPWIHNPDYVGHDGQTFAVKVR